MTSVAYITALVVGVFAVIMIPSSKALTTDTNIAIPAHKDELVNISPLTALEGKRKLTQEQLIDLLRAVGFKGQALKTAWAVAMRESNGRPIAHNDNVATGDNSYGIFQINMLGNLGDARREKFGLTANADLFDPVTNAKVAFHMTKGGTDWTSWGLGHGAYDGTSAEPRVTQLMTQFPQS